MERQVMAEEKIHTAQARAADAQREVDALKRDVQALRGDLKDLLRVARGTTSDRIEEAKMRLRDSMRGFGETTGAQAHEVYETARLRGQETIAKARAKVEQRPLTGLLIAAAVGLVAGALLKRR